MKRNIAEKAIELGRALYPIDFSKESRRCFHFSFLFKNNKLLCVGENAQKTHSRNRFNLKEFDVSLKHSCSELILFCRAKKKLNVNWARATVVNLRIDRNGNIRNSKPCASCQNLIAYLGIKDLYYSMDDGSFEKYEN